MHKVIQTSKKTCEAEEKGLHYVFDSKEFKDESRVELRRIGGLLMWQPDPDKVQTLFPTSRYLIDIDKKDNASTGKKSAHEMRGVLLTILFLVLSDNANQLKKLMGKDTLSKWVKICTLTLMLEAFLNKEEYYKWELNMAEIFINKYITDFCHCVNRQEGLGMKLIKIHLLRHFVDCIRMYGSTANFNGATNESHLKNKKKQPAWRTKMRPVHMEYQTAMKYFKQILLSQGFMEIRSLGEVISKKIWEF